MKALIAFALALVSSAAAAQARFEAFGGYSYVNADFNGIIPRQSMNGWESSFSAGTRWIAAEGDVSGYYKGYTDPLVKVTARDYSVAGGPRVSYRPIFVHALFGVDHLKGDLTTRFSPVVKLSGSQNAFAMAIGGGAEIPVGRTGWSARIGGDYLLSRHNVFDPSVRFNQHNARGSVGLVYTFNAGRRPDSTANSPQTIPRDMQAIRALGVAGEPAAGGFRVAYIQPGGPAATLGIRPGDYIRSVNGQPASDAETILRAMGDSSEATIVFAIRNLWVAERTVALQK